MASSTIYEVQYTGTETIALVTMAGKLKLFDIRQGFSRCVNERIAPRKFGSLCSLATHPQNTNVFGVGSSLGHIALYDLRIDRKTSSAVGMTNWYENEQNSDFQKTAITDLRLITGKKERKSHEIRSERGGDETGIIRCGNDGEVVRYWLNRDFHGGAYDREEMKIDPKDRKNVKTVLRPRVMQRNLRKSERREPIYRISLDAEEMRSSFVRNKEKEGDSRRSLWSLGEISENDKPRFLLDSSLLQTEDNPMSCMDWDEQRNLLCTTCETGVFGVSHAFI